MEVTILTDRTFIVVYTIYDSEVPRKFPNRQIFSDQEPDYVLPIQNHH